MFHKSAAKNAHTISRARIVAVLSGVLVTTLILVGFATTRIDYTIIDGEKSYSVTGAFYDPEGAISEAGLVLGEYDRYDVSTADGAGTITIYRGKTFSVTCDGATATLQSSQPTVGEALAETGYTLYNQDVLSVSASAVLTEGMEITITRRTEKSYRITSAVAYETQYVANSELALGSEQVTSEGQNGSQTETYAAQLEDGKVVSTELVSTDVTKAATPKIVEYGTKVSSSSSWLDATGNKLTNVDPHQNTITLTDGTVYTYSDCFSVTATAYTTQRKGWNKTATGTVAREGEIAVDPDVIPYGTKVFIITSDGSVTYGVATAEDCGGAISGNKVDLFYDTYNECIYFGRQTCTLYVLDG